MKRIFILSIFFILISKSVLSNDFIGFISDNNSFLEINNKQSSFGSLISKKDILYLPNNKTSKVFIFDDCKEYLIKGESENNLLELPKELNESFQDSICFSINKYKNINNFSLKNNNIDPFISKENINTKGDLFDFAYILHNLSIKKYNAAKNKFKKFKLIHSKSEAITKINSLFDQVYSTKSLPIIGFVGKKSSSIIIEVEGVAYLGENDTPNETRKKALLSAKRNAAEAALTNIESQTIVKNYVLDDDIIIAKSKSEVIILEQKNLPTLNNEYKVWVKAEVKTFETKQEKKDIVEFNEYSPLNVTLWSSKNIYLKGEKLSLFVKVNKPAYIIIDYIMADESKIQLFPNQHWEDNYLNSEKTLKVPSKEMNFDFTISPPFGKEKIKVYASTVDINKTNLKTRGITIRKNNDYEELSESELTVITKE